MSSKTAEVTNYKVYDKYSLNFKRWCRQSHSCSQLARFEHVAEETLYGYASDGLTEKQFFYSLWVDHSQGRKHKKQFSKANLLTGKVPPDVITQHYLCLVLVAFHLLRIS